MEFNEKLIQLRKQKGITQEELANALYVSRTAVSKWESGRGYPSIESLKAIAKFFSITVDELLSADEAVTIAEKDKRSAKSHFRDLIFGSIDICMILLIFMPLFATRTDGVIQPSSLITLDGVELYLKIPYFLIVISMTLMGIVTLALQNCEAVAWIKSKSKISLALGFTSVILFALSLQPYAAVFALALLAVKVIILTKRQ